MSYDIVIAYRIYPKISKTPFYYPTDKFKLASLALHSFRNAFGELNVKLFVLLDSCPDEYHRLFQDLFPQRDLELISLNKAGNHKTYEKQVDILSGQNDAEVVYFAEDDYLYKPGSLETAFQFFTSAPDIHFVSLYDHSQYYTNISQNTPTNLRYNSGMHWRRSGSTCLTFMTAKNILRRTSATLKSFCRGNHDCSMWFNLTKQSVLNPFNLVKAVKRKDIESISIFLKAWRYGAKPNLLGPKYNLWTPVPSLATHLDKPFIAPKVNWEHIKRTTEREVSN